MTTSYQAYVYNQTVKYMSHEDDHVRWKNGQIRFINHFLLPILDATNDPLHLLDAGCGDGAGLTYLRELGFTNVLGLDLSEEKLARAKAAGHDVRQADLHDLSSIADASFDIVYSSHCLEHCHDPAKVVGEFRRVAKPGATFVIVLPFPDNGPEDAHCGASLLGTRVVDGGTGVRAWFAKQGLETISWAVDSYREPEIWLWLGAGPSVLKNVFD